MSLKLLIVGSPSEYRKGELSLRVAEKPQKEEKVYGSVEFATGLKSYDLYALGQVFEDYMVEHDLRAIP